MIKAHYIVLILLLLGISSYAQITKNDPKWAKEESRLRTFPESKYFVEFTEVKGVRKSSTIVKDRDLLIIRLKKQVTGRISTIVYSESTLSREETLNDGFQESFQSNTKITSNINISGSFTTRTSYNKKTKTLFGIIAVNKKKLGNSYTKYLRSGITTLDQELRFYNTNNKSVRELEVDVTKFNNRLGELKLMLDIISTTGVKVSSKIINDFAPLSSMIDEIRNKINKVEIEETINKAQSYFANHNYDLALSTYEIAQLKLPDDKRINNGIKQSKKQLEKQYVNNANNYTNRGEYDLAVNEYESLFSRLPETRSKYEKKYKKIEKYAFDIYAERLEFAIDNMALSDVELALKRLKEYQYVNPKSYNKYYQRVKKYAANELYALALIQYHDEEYSQSINTINKAISIQNNNKFKKLREKSKHKLYRIEYKKYKKTRPFKYSIQIGGGVQTQNSIWSTYQKTEEVQIQYIPSASIGFYKKYGKNVNVFGSGRDRSKKNLIGLKYSYIFRQGYYSNLDNINELELVIGFARKYLLNVGVASFSIDPDIEKNSIETISTSLVRRFYMHPIEFQLEIKAYMDSKINIYPVLKLSIFIHANLIRNVKHNDKKRIKYKYGAV